MSERTFALYPEARHWWSFADYGAVLDVVTRLEARRVLEFGPGSSTLALIEGGATQIDTCEDDPTWAATYEERLVSRFPAIVRLHRYTWRKKISIPTLEAGAPYDLALIDGPLETTKRGPVMDFAAARSRALLVPADETVAGRSPLRPQLEKLAAKLDASIEWMDTGPLAGGFALLVRP